MDCNELVELITDYLEGTLASSDRTRFDEHLTICDGCTEYLDQMRATLNQPNGPRATAACFS